MLPYSQMRSGHGALCSPPDHMNGPGRRALLCLAPAVCPPHHLSHRRLTWGALQQAPAWLKPSRSEVQAQALQQWALATLNCAAQPAREGLGVLALCHTSASCLSVLAQHAQQLVAAPSGGAVAARPIAARQLRVVQSGQEGGGGAGHRHAAHGGGGGGGSGMHLVDLRSAEAGTASRAAGQQEADWDGAEGHSLALLEALQGQMQEQGMGPAAGRVLLRCMLLLQALWPLAPGLDREGEGP